jgi:hypothetical protein
MFEDDHSMSWLICSLFDVDGSIASTLFSIYKEIYRSLNNLLPIKVHKNVETQQMFD